MAITYNAGTNIITITGYTSGTPCTFLDVYNADVAGGWGVVTRQCTNQFCFDAQLYIGDGSTATYFADKLKYVHWNNIWTAHFQSTIRGRTNSHATFVGCSLSVIMGTYAVGFGGDIISAEFAPDFNLSYCKVSAISTFRALEFSTVTGKLEHSVVYNSFIRNPSSFDIYDTVHTVTDTTQNIYGIMGPFTGGTVNDLKINDSPIAVYQPATTNPLTIKNMLCNNISQYDIRSHNNSSNIYLINCVFDSATWRFDFSSYTGTSYRQYEFDLKVIDKDNVAINGATAKIWDKDSNLVVDTTTNASGVIATQTITRGYYNQANGNTLQEASPHLIKIEKAGYTMYEADFTLGDKTDWIIALQAAGGGLMRNPPMTGGMV